MEEKPNAAARRKRRSSILKSQRPPRAPFSDLEFHVATPTDTNKSRRVSFSKRTGVAEFATNEATTTWKNVYEEQNKSLEFSGHDSVKHETRASVGHLGNRMFEQMFQETEADIDYCDAIGVPNTGGGSSFNVTQQFAMLDCMDDDKKLTVPSKNFDLSSFTENQHSSKVFKNNLTNLAINEMTDQIKIDFSAVQGIGGNDVNSMDDLDAIQNDLVFSQPCSVSGPSFGNRRDTAQYTGRDLNSTRAVFQDNSESDMSITDTIRSPKKEVSTSSFPDVKKLSMNKDWTDDKENIVVNPYVTPAESDNFAVDKEPEKVLVFDGKKIKYADINADLDELVDASEKKPRKSMLNRTDKSIKSQNISTKAKDMSLTQVVQKRQTIVFENDDIDADLSMTQAISDPIVKSDKTLLFNEQDGLADMSVTQAVPRISNPVVKTDITLLFNQQDDLADMSVTQAVPRISNPVVKTDRTVLFNQQDDLADMSITQAVPRISNHVVKTDRTLLFNQQDDLADMSVTQAVPSKFSRVSKCTNESKFEESMNADLDELVDVRKKKPKKSILNRTDKSIKTQNISHKAMDMSVTQVVQKRQTIVFENDDIDADLSMTQVISNPVVKYDRTLLFNQQDDLADMSVTQAVPSKLSRVSKSTNESIKAKFEESLFADMSFTKIAPVLESKDEVIDKTSKRQTIVFHDDVADISLTEKTTLYDKDENLADMSVTKAISNKIISTMAHKKSICITEDVSAADIKDVQKMEQKRDIMSVYPGDDVSLTQMVPENVAVETMRSRKTTLSIEKDSVIMTTSHVIPNKSNTKRQTIVLQSNCENGNMSITQPIRSEVAGGDKNKRNTIVFEDDKSDISLTQAIPVQTFSNSNGQSNGKRKTIVFEDSIGDISMTQAIPTHILSYNNNDHRLSEVQTAEISKRKTILFDDAGEVSMTHVIPAQIMPRNEIHTDENKGKRKTIVFEDSMGDISLTQSIPVQIISDLIHHERQKGKSKPVLLENSAGDISMTQAIPAQIIARKEISSDENTEKRKTIVFENSMGDISITQEISAQMLTNLNMKSVLKDQVKPKTIVLDDDKVEFSMTQAIPTQILAQTENAITSSETQTKMDGIETEVKSVQTSSFMPIVINQNVIVYHASPSKSKITDKADSNFSTESEITKISEEILCKTSEETSAKTSEESFKSSEDIHCDNLNAYTSSFNSSKSDVFVKDNNGAARINPDIISNILCPSGINPTDSEDSNSRVDKNPSSKGDEFHTSSDKITEPVAILNNPQVAHGHQAPRLLYKKAEGLFRKSEEQKILSISYDAIATSSSKIDNDSEGDDFSNKEDDIQKKSSPRSKPVTLIDNASKRKNETKNSILNDLLDMSDDANEINDITLSKSISFGEKFAKMFNQKSPRSEKKYLIKDENYKTTTKETNTLGYAEILRPDLEDDEDNKSEDNSDDGLQKKLQELQTSRRMSMSNTHLVEENRPEPENEDINWDKYNLTLKNKTRGTITCNLADDTSDLLEMLSKLTDKTLEDNDKVLQQNEVTEKSAESAISLASNEDKRETEEADIETQVENNLKQLLKRFSFKEDKLDNSDCGENSAKSTVIKKLIRISNEIVKTLHFDEDVDEETSPQKTITELFDNDSDSTYNEVLSNEMANMSNAVTALKKSFVDLKESTSEKSKVIPTYALNDGLKELMSDLVKPMADVIPLSCRLSHGIKDKPSTCSTQIQANLISSSQIDVDVDPMSNVDSANDLDSLKRRSYVLDNKHTSGLTEEEEIKLVSQDEPIKSAEERVIEKEPIKESTVPDSVVVFDQANPLNNVLVAPIDLSDAHEYNPKSGLDSNQSSTVSIVKRMEFDITLKSKLENMADEMQSGDSVEVQDVMSNVSFPSKASTISTVSRASELMDAEVNTVLAMKDNKELLAVSSSLTLVDEKKSSITCVISLDDESEPEFMELDEPESNKAKKRSFSPSNPEKYATSSLDLTPKPSIKLQKRSFSPRSNKKSPSQVRFNLEVESLSKPKTPNSNMEAKSPRSSPTFRNRTPSPHKRSPSPKKIISTKKPSPERKSPPKNRRPSTNITVQQLITHYGEDIVNRSIKKLVKDISPSKIQDIEVFSRVPIDPQQSDRTPEQTPAETQGNSFSDNADMETVMDVNRKGFLDSDSVGDLVDKINSLTFIGKECEWESRRLSEWSFLVLHSRLRITLHMSGDQLTRVSVDVARHEPKNSIAALTVQVTSEVLRYMTSSPTSPHDVCALLRRCACVARVADKWARAMRDAKLRLAVKVMDDRVVSFKAVNVPLREVWDVKLRIETSLCEDSAWPWPRAVILRVARVTGDGSCQLKNAQRALDSVKKCWGHVPEGIWAIFNYLKKYKPREDPLLGLLS